jgi:hypothetical protein
VLLLLGIAAAALGLCHLRRISMLKDAAIPEGGFLGFKGPSFVGIDNAETHIRQMLICPPFSLPYMQTKGLPGGLCLLAFVIVQTIMYAWKAWWFQYSLDGFRFNLFWVATATILYGSLFFILLRFLAVWHELHLLLRRLSMHPTRGCYGAMREKRIPAEPDLRLRFVKPVHDTTSVEYCLERVRELLREMEDQNGNERSCIAGCIVGMIRRCEAWLQSLQASVENWEDGANNDLILQGGMAALSSIITREFDRVWRIGSSSSPPAAVIGEAKQHKLVEQAEYFMASRVLDYLRRVYPQMQNVVGFAIAGILAQMLAVSSYPLPASNTLLTLAWIGLLAAIGVSVYVFVRMNMNPVISLLQGTSPDHLSFTGSFVFQLFVVGFLPIMTMLGAQFPHPLGAIVSWVSGISSHAGS